MPHMVMGLTDLKTSLLLAPSGMNQQTKTQPLVKLSEREHTEPDLSAVLGSLDTGTALPGDLNWHLTQTLC